MRRFLRMICALGLCAAILTLCSSHTALQVYDGLLQIAGKASLSPDFFLKGQRNRSDDGYTGAYHAQYKRFTGSETLLGGINSLEEKNITVACSIQSQSGSLKLLLESGKQTEIILSGDGTCNQELSLKRGSNYICAVGDDFTGTLHLKVVSGKENTLSAQ